MKSESSVAAVALAFVSGCAQLNEGSVDHRWVKPFKATAGSASPNVPTNTSPMESKFFQRVDDKQKINKEDSLAITLETVFIRGFQEQPWSPRGEFIVLANAREIGTGNTAKIEFGAAAEDGAKVVYYTGDLRQRELNERGQFLSQTSLPLFGPLQYTGRPVLVELHTVEIDDNEAEQSKALLAAVAQLGQMAYVPASPALGVLKKLGESILSGAQNDKELRYHAMLYPTAVAGDGFTHSALMAGDIVLMKRGNSRYGIIATDSGDAVEIPWDRLVLNPINKRLYLAGTPDEAKSLSQ